jgi:hypothetical protein
MTRRHSFFRKVIGKIIHVTSINGLTGILEDGRIRAETPGTKRGYCQTINCISVLNLDLAKIDKIEAGWNWTGVFTEHVPAIALILSDSIMPNLKHFEIAEILGKPGLYIAEAEVCHNGDIPVSSILEGWIIARRYRISYRSPDLQSVLKTAVSRQPQLKWRKPNVLNILSLPQE